MMYIRRWLCRMLDCHALCGEQQEQEPLPSVSPEVDEKEQAYREASHEMRNAVVELQGAAKRYISAFDALADRWDK